MEPRQTSEVNFTPIFVGGSPRSGTTLLNSLICSSTEVNHHMQECSYFTWNIQPLKLALSTFERSQGHYFQSIEQLFSFHGEILKQILIATWKQEDCPKFLCLKNPNMIKDFSLLSPIFPMAKFVAIVRDPLDIIASRYEAEKRGDSEFALDAEFIESEIANINEIHTAVLDYFRECPNDRILVIEYERLVSGFCLDNLRQFLGLPDIDGDNVWSRAKENMHSENSQWITPLYGKPIQGSNIGKHQQVLNREIVDYVVDKTGDSYSQVQILTKD